MPHPPRTDRPSPAAALIAVGLVAASLGACSADSNAASDQVTVSDSAGVRLIEYAPGALDGAPEWRLGQPIFDVGVLDGPTEYQLFRVSSAVRLDDGAVVLANAGTGEIRAYDSEGAYLGGVGGMGDGPEEFRRPMGVALIPGDSLVVFDDRLLRLSILPGSLDGVARTARLGGAMLNVVLVGTVGERELLFFDSRLEVPTDTDEFTENQFELYRYDLSGTRTDSLGPHPSFEIGIIGDPDDMLVGSRDFAPRTAVAPGRAGFWIGYAKSPEVRHLDLSGTLTAIVRWDEASVSVTEAHRDSIFQWRLAEAGEDREGVTRMRFEGFPAVDAMPPYRRLQGDRVGRLWVEDYVPDYHMGDGPASWTIFSADGETALGRLRLSTDARVLDAGEDWLLVVEPDALDVEHVRLYPIERGDP